MQRNKEIRKLVRDLQEYRTAYYEGNEEISDEEFDQLEERLRELDPNNDYFNKVGYKQKINNDTVEHLVPMLSMEKVKTAELAKKWMCSLYLNNESNVSDQKLYNAEWIIQPKIDGNSCTIKYDRNGRFVYMATRGDGNKGFKIKYGEEILKNNDLPFILYNPNTDDYDKYYGHEIELRGELYIEQNTTEISPPLRNACAGIIKRIEKSKELSEIKVCLYGVVDNTYRYFMSYGNEFPSSIDKKKTIIPYTTKCKIQDIETIYEKYLNKVRMELPFETDGLVIYYPHEEKYRQIDNQYKISHHHHYNMALKPMSQGSETYIKAIEYNVSKYGILIPKAILNPIIIQNSMISNVTLSNFDLIQQRGLKIGSKVRVDRANDVIPYLKEVIGEMENSKEITIPKACPSCNGKVIYSKDDKNLICTNPKCKGKLTSQILFFCDKMKVKGLAEKSILKVFESLYGYSINSLESFFKVFLKERKFMLDLLGVNYEKILVLLLQAFDKISLKELIAYGAFIPSVGLKTLEKEEINDIEEWIKNIVNTPTSVAWKLKLKQWYEEDENSNYNKLIDLYLFITQEKILIQSMKNK